MKVLYVWASAWYARREEIDRLKSEVSLLERRLHSLVHVRRDFSEREKTTTLALTLDDRILRDSTIPDGVILTESLRQLVQELRRKQ